MSHDGIESGDERSSPSAGPCPVPEHGWSHIARAINLTRRELEIVRAMFHGLSETAIAQQLGISVHTVHTHIRRMYRKLGVQCRGDFILRVVSAHVARVPDPVLRESSTSVRAN